MIFLQDLVLVGWDIFHNALHGASEDAAEVIDGGGVQGLVLTELIDGGTGNPVVFDQCIGGLRRIAQGVPKWSVRYHVTASSRLVIT